MIPIIPPVPAHTESRFRFIEYPSPLDSEGYGYARCKRGNEGLPRQLGRDALFYDTSVDDSNE